MLEILDDASDSVAASWAKATRCRLESASVMRDIAGTAELLGIIGDLKDYEALRMARAGDDQAEPMRLMQKSDCPVMALRSFDCPNGTRIEKGDFYEMDKAEANALAESGDVQIVAIEDVAAWLNCPGTVPQVGAAWIDATIDPCAAADIGDGLRVASLLHGGE